MPHVLIHRHPTYGLLWIDAADFDLLFDVDGRHAVLKPDAEAEFDGTYTCLDTLLQCCATMHIRSCGEHVGAFDDKRTIRALYVWKERPEQAASAES
jgi:hypothetical protein